MDTVLSNSGDYVTVRKNLCYENAGCGIQLNADHSMGGDGIISYSVVEENVIFRNGKRGGGAINLDGVCD